MLDPTVALLLEQVRVDEVLEHVAGVARFDRYQASDGLSAAADLVAAAAAGAGLSNVEIFRYPADGAPRWWTFRAPLAWTPVRARLVLSGPAGDLDLDHAAEPFAVATYSAATPPGGHRVPLRHLRGNRPLAGALVVADRAGYLDGGLLPALSAAGAAGFVTDGPSRADSDRAANGRAPGRRGRVELPPGSELTAFSLTPDELRLAGRFADTGGSAWIEIALDRSATMPLVTGLLPGADARLPEIWVTAHLCHPRPSANDNASGVAAALGAAAALGRARRADPRLVTARGIRFFWGPEFLGTAAALHAAHTSGNLPAGVLNLDMVGEDQRRCAAPFVVERPPDCQPSLLAPLAEAVVDTVFRATRTADGGRWCPQEFDGFSDHALFADPSVRRPAVQFCHPADRFNHSAADSPDKVSPVEMLRSTTAAAALLHLAAAGPVPGAVVPDVVERWCARQLAESRALAATQDDPDWGAGLVGHVSAATAAVRALLPGGRPVPARTPGTGPVLRHAWDGPLNLRAMQQALPAGTRTTIAGLVAAEKYWLSALFHLAIRADGTRGRAALVQSASYAMRRPLDRHICDVLVDALLESGWVVRTGHSR